MVSVITLIHQLPKASEVKSFITATIVASVTIPSRRYFLISIYHSHKLSFQQEEERKQIWTLLLGIMRGQFAQRPRGTRTVSLLPSFYLLQGNSPIHEEARKFSYQIGVKVVVVYGVKRAREMS
ncbi:hypothetical protein L1887_38298 [Cichorium endivia]|nr:hypothetical protein L1887_38298 [Cichorium endivia]